MKLISRINCGKACIISKNFTLYRHFNSTSPVQDSQYQLYQPASPWERDVGRGESLTPATLWEPHGNVAWKNEIDLESEETRDDFQSTRHFGMVNR